jgi:WD40 repeat protein
MEVFDLEKNIWVAKLNGDYEINTKNCHKTGSSFLKNVIVINENLFAAACSGVVKVWNTQSFECVHNFFDANNPGGFDGIGTLLKLDDDHLLNAFHNSNDFYIWDLKNPTILKFSYDFEEKK